MHVVHLYKDYDPPVIGGIERMIRWTAVRTARREGCRVSVVVATPADREHAQQAPEVEEIDGVVVRRVPSWGRPGGSPLCPGMAREALALGPDIIHAHHPCPMADLALRMMSPERRPPFVVTWHSDVVRQRAAYRVYRPLQRWLLRHAAVVMPTSQRYLESSAQLAPARERSRVVPLGVDFDETTNQPDPALVEQWRAKLGDAPIVLFVGVLRYYKGLSILLDAWARGGEPGHLVIVGAGPERDNLQAQHTATPGDASRPVTLAGRLPDADVAALRSIAAFAVMPSHLRSEAFGLGQIESMAAGLPVIACDLETGVPEVNQNEVSGIIVPPSDPAALNDAINRLLRCEELRGVLGDGARDRARTLYHADRMEENIHAVYREVLDRD